jgi:type IV secretory pathway VirD2 relaxase
MADSDQRAPIVRPRIGGRGGHVSHQRVPGFRQSVLIRAQQRFKRLSAGPVRGRITRAGTPGAAADVPRPGPGCRRCVIKARVVQMRAGGVQGARLHVDYIERDGVEKDGSQGRLYSTGTADVRRSLTETLAGERHQFRFIISPEDAEKLDLTAFTREFIAQVERDTGRRLIWGAVNHHDTDNPHVHVVVRGVDAAGKEVRLEPAYISERMRWQAQHLVTRELGPRTRLEVSRQLTREISQERFTTVDRKLAQLLSPSRTVDTRRLALTTDGPNRARAMARLAVLEQFGFAQRTSPRSWQLLENWEESLRALGKRGDIIKRIHAALRGQGDPARYVIIDGTTEHPPIEGIVRRKGLHDELRGDIYAVVETAAGRAHYVRLDAATAEGLREGGVVRLDASRERWARKIDHVIQQVAGRSGGVYDPTRHLRELAAGPPTGGGKAVEPTAVVAATVARLERLERKRLVSRRSDGTWSVPPDLVDVLARREQSEPTFRTRVEVLSPAPTRDVRYPGPTWLEGQRLADPSRAPYGFGADLAVALRSRAAYLEELGICGTPGDVKRSLQRHEHLALGATIARELGCQFVADPGPGFRGRLFACEPTPTGCGFVRIVDEASRRVALLPATGVPGALEGQPVELTRDPKGRLIARTAGLSRGE